MPDTLYGELINGSQIMIFKDLIVKINKHIFLESANKLFQFVLFSFMSTWVLKFLGAKVGHNCRIYTPLLLSNTCFHNLKIGDNCHIGRDVLIDLAGEVCIGNNVTISMRSTLITHVNFGDSATIRMGYQNQIGSIFIEDGVYVGANTTILHRVRIGRNSIIGACSLVREDIPPCSLFVGVPAKAIKKTNMSDC